MWKRSGASTPARGAGASTTRRSPSSAIAPALGDLGRGAVRVAVARRFVRVPGVRVGVAVRALGSAARVGVDGPPDADGAREDGDADRGEGRQPDRRRHDATS